MLILDHWIYYPNYRFTIDYNVVISSTTSIIPYRNREDIFRNKYIRVEFNYGICPKIKVLAAIGNIIIELFGILIGSSMYVILVKLFNHVSKKFDILINVKAFQQILVNPDASEFLKVYTYDSEQPMMLLNIPYIDKLTSKCINADEYLVSDMKVNDKIEDLLLDYIIANFGVGNNRPFFINVNLRSDVDVTDHCDKIITQMLFQNDELCSLIEDTNSMFSWELNFEPLIENFFTNLSTEIRQTFYNKNVLLNKAIPSVIPINTITQFGTSGFLNKQHFINFNSEPITLNITDSQTFFSLINIATELLRCPVSYFVITPDVDDIQYYIHNGLLQLTNPECQQILQNVIYSIEPDINNVQKSKTKNNKSLYKNVMEEIQIGDICIDAVSLLFTFWY